jgi:hypothetical protein
MKIVLFLLIVTHSLFALTHDQIKAMKIGYSVGKTITAKNGMTFENTLASIPGQESSWCVNVVGDKYDKNGKLKSLYESSLGCYQIKLSTAKLVIKKNPHLLKKYEYLVYNGSSIYIKYEKNKKKLDYFKRVLKSPTWNKRLSRGEDKAIRTFAWANRELRKHKIIHNSLLRKARKDTLLINRLLTDTRFSAEIAGNYIRMMYEHVIAKGWSQPYKRSIGRYNGGWSNWTYANKILKRMKTVKKYI